MRLAAIRPLAALLLIHAAATSAVACCAVVVGRGASADGSVLLGHNEENGGRRVLYFHKIPVQKHAPGSIVRLDNGGQVQQVPETAAMLWSENPDLAYSDGYLTAYCAKVAEEACRKADRLGQP
jgi:dipeptidase